MNLEFDAASHAYTVDGRRVGLSVTQVLKRMGLIDFSGVPDLILEKARARGTAVHQAIHFWNEGDLDVDRFARDFPDAFPYFDAWRNFCSQRQFRAVLCEQRIYSERLDVAGTIDCLGVLDGRGVLLDFATGDPADVAKDLQTAGYLGIAREWLPHDPALADYFAEYKSISRYGVALRADRTFRVEHYNDPSDWRRYCALVDALRIVDGCRRRAPERIANVESVS